jgi:hypothetical protein
VTTPGGSAPDGAWVLGSDYGKSITEESAKVTMKTPVINVWEGAQINWRQWLEKPFDTFADLKDGQIAYNDRVDLLNQVSGFSASVMGRNWLVPLSTWVRVPFGVQVGPGKRAGVEPAVPENVGGRLIIKAGGLWRVDALMNCLGYTRRYNWGGLTGVDTYDYWPLSVTYLLEVVNSAGTVLTSRECKSQAGNQFTSVSIPQDPTVAQSVAFSHTFVLDNIDEANSATWSYVRMSMRADGINNLFTVSRCSIYGGTSKSALAATRWSKDSGPTGTPTVGDGGTLT